MNERHKDSNSYFFKKYQKDGSVSKTLITQTWEHEFRSLAPHKNKAHQHTSVTPRAQGVETSGSGGLLPAILIQAGTIHV